MGALGVDRYRPPMAQRPHREIDRAIARLALPAFGALVAQPLFLLIDAAIVGTLGTEALAGLGAASTIFGAVVGLCIFLSYAATAAVARLFGAGDRAGALSQGVDGMVLGVVLGVGWSGVGEFRRCIRLRNCESDRRPRSRWRSWQRGTR